MANIAPSRGSTIRHHTPQPNMAAHTRPTSRQYTASRSCPIDIIPSRGRPAVLGSRAFLTLRSGPALPALAGEDARGPSKAGSEAALLDAARSDRLGRPLPGRGTAGHLVPLDLRHPRLADAADRPFGPEAHEE